MGLAVALVGLLATRDHTPVVYGLAGSDPTSTTPAGDDFAQCPLELPACTDTLVTCCKRPFDPIGQGKAIVIPMDRCHQQLANGGPQSPPDEGAPAWCREMGTSADQGMLEAYGLVYRLMQRGVPVYWLINPSKSPQGRDDYVATDVDAWVLSPGAAPPATGADLDSCGFFCTPPVARLDPTSLAPVTSYDRQQFPLRGSAWVIAAEDRAAFDTFWFDLVAGASGGYYDFKDVDLYEVQGQSTFAYQAFHEPTADGFSLVAGAPVAIKVDYPPPRLAKLAGGPSDNWLARARLDQRASNPDCLSAPFQPSDAVYCDITAAEVGAGLLNTNDIDWAWMDQGGFDCADVDQFREFLSADGTDPGRSMLLMEGVIDDIERCPGREVMGRLNGGLATRSPSVAGPFIQRYPANLMLQYGDIEADFAQGSVSGWYVSGNGSAGYEPRGTLVRLVTKDDGTQCDENVSTPACDNADDDIDLLSYVRHEDSPENGIALYAPGNNLVPANNRAHLRVVLNALIALPTSTGQVAATGETGFAEVARSTPIVTTVGDQVAVVQGSFEYPTPLPPRPVYEGAGDDDSFSFPHIRGHFRALVAANLGEQEQTFDSAAALFDVAADGLPAANAAGCGAASFTGSCRTVFTNVESGRLPTQVSFDATGVDTLEPALEGGIDLTGDETRTLIARVLAGAPGEGGAYEPALGGVDRSTPAVIGASALVGGARPKMAYFGGLDGMLHAVCASDTPPCDALGRELWAYIPRTQLPLLRSNAQRIDGSPLVLDAAGDFDADGSFEFRTVLAFATGSGDPGDADQAPVIVGLDVTDPTAPLVLWEVVTDGQGLRLAASPVRVGNATKNLIFASTNRGDAEAGIVTYAIDAATGEVQWRVERAYPSSRSGGPDVPQSGIPAGPTAVDLDNVGFATHVVVPTLYGEVFLLRADDGTNEFGNRPLFSFTTDFHPIGVPASIYLDASNTPFAVIGTGGYADPLGVTGWAPDEAEQYVVSFALTPPDANVPLDETTDGELIGLRTTLPAGERVFAQPTVAGGELFVVTDSEDINDLPAYAASPPSGALRRFDLATGSQKGSAVVLSGGASSVDVRDGAAYSASGTGAQRIDVSSDFSPDGAAVDVAQTPKLRRQLWFRRR